MNFRNAPWCILSVLVAGCSDPATPADAAADTRDALDVADGYDVPAVPDAPDVDVAEVSFRCPTGSLDPVFSQPCAGYEGAECRYGYTVPACGGRTQTCRAGRWEEVHTDPSSACFDAGADTATDTATDAAPDTATDTAVDAPADGAADAGNACLAAGGICLGRGADCTGGGGAVSAAGAAGCRFSDGDGVCCVPPAAMPTGDSCAAHGGLCAPIAGCNFVQGSFAPPRCTGVGVVCCVPRSVCGQETQVCCAPGGATTFRPSCDRGTYRCTIDGTTLMPRDRCP